MQIDIQLTAGKLDPNPCFTSEQARFNAYVSAIQSGLPINFTTVIMSQTAPGPDDRDKVWVSTDGNGRILGVFTFSNGAWQTIAPIAPYLIIGELRWYDPSLYTPISPWFPCDGSITAQNSNGVGVPDLRGRFLIGAGQRIAPAAVTYTNPDGTTFSVADSNTNFSSGATGGTETVVTTPAQSVPHLHNALAPNTGFLCTGSGGGGGQGSNAWGGEPTTADALGNAAGNTDPHPNLPPYYAAAIMQWRPDLT